MMLKIKRAIATIFLYVLYGNNFILVVGLKSGGVNTTGVAETSFLCDTAFAFLSRCVERSRKVGKFGDKFYHMIDRERNKLELLRGR